MLDLAPAADEVARLLDGVHDEDLAGPTPSEDCSLATLLAQAWPLHVGATKQGVPQNADESPDARGRASTRSGRAAAATPARARRA